jgi:hypothetical protein
MRHRVERAALGVAADVEREDHLGGELAASSSTALMVSASMSACLRHGLEIIDDLEALRASRTACRAGAGV